MTKAKLYAFNNKFTGDVQVLTKAEGAKLNEDWSRIKVVTNEQGERVLRLQFHGATADISENKVLEALPDGNRLAE